MLKKKQANFKVQCNSVSIQIIWLCVWKDWGASNYEVFPFSSCSGKSKNPQITQRTTTDMCLIISKHASFLFTLIQNEINNLAIVKSFYNCLWMLGEKAF